MSSPTFTVLYEADVSYQEVFRYPNTGSSAIGVKWDLPVSETVDYLTFDGFFNTIASEQLGTGLNIYYKPISATIDIDESDPEQVLAPDAVDAVEKTMKRTNNQGFSQSASIPILTKVPPHSTVAFYQQTFKAFGINVASRYTPPEAHPPQKVFVRYTVQRLRFISDIKVVYGDKASDIPNDAVAEYNGRDNNINAGFGGKFVWLVPIYTDDPDKAAVRFDLIIQGSQHDGWDDLAKGAGGLYRYIRPVYDTADRYTYRLTELSLYRDTKSIVDFPPIYVDHTRDINDQRMVGTLSFLYLLWAPSRL